jgi:hypothetical protein
MKTYISVILLILTLGWSVQVEAQNKKNRVQPGRMYAPGDTLFAPRLGFTARVPNGWEGTLPRESEVFMLSSTSTTYGEIFIFGNPDGNLNGILEKWKNGVALTESIKLKATNPTINDGMLTSEVIATGDYINKGYKGFAVARCNPDGPCVIALLVAPVQFYESVKTIVSDFMKSSTFEAPANISIYADFDWKDFLSNKVLITYQSMQGGVKENMIHLCADGTFQSDLKHTGMFKDQNPRYRGKNTGTWKLSGNGPVTTITFTFKDKKLSPIEAELTIEDEKILSNGERYYVGHSDKCK